MKQSGKRFERLLVATDFTQGADFAVARAVRLPLSAGATVHLLHMLPENLPPKIRKRAKQEAWSKLQRTVSVASKAARAAGASKLVITPSVVTGRAYIEIVRKARRLAADLVIIGRHGRRGIRDLLIGSTAIRVIRTGNFPVLVVNRKPAKNYLRPLVAVGLEDTSWTVLDLARQALDPAVAAMPVVHAYWPPFEAALLAALTPKELYEFHHEYEDKAESALQKIVSSIPGKKTRWKTVVRRGDPRSVVLDEAARRRSDLIVVGSHSRSGLSHVLLGSVAEWLIIRARCDVLVARPTRLSFKLP